MTFYRFTLYENEKKTKRAFRSSWFFADDVNAAIEVKDEFLSDYPEYASCWVSWENKEKY